MTVDVETPRWEPALLRVLAGWNPAVPARALTRALAYVWASPISLVGLVAGAATAVRPTRREGVLLFPHARGITGWVLRKRHYAAGTFGHVVVCTRDPEPSLMAHELIHTRQAERFGPLMAPVYLGLLAIYRYRRHPMERAARLAEQRLTDQKAAAGGPARARMSGDGGPPDR
ncbi:MAG: hypothetical protein ACRD0K_16220 [Egibacteraceae bacterium]